MTKRTDVFSQWVRDFQRTDVLRIDAATPLSETVGRMATEKRSAAIVTDPAGHVAGIITEQDIVRRVALRADASQASADIMSSPVETIGGDEYLYYAVARMRRLGYRHMPVTGADGGLTGILDLNDAIGHAAAGLMEQIDDLSHEDSIDGMREVKAAQVRLARELADEGLPVNEIQSLLTHINNDVYRRVVDLGIAAMEADGRGAAPVPFTVIVMGSGGRNENYVYPDQDNGFIIDDFPDSDHRANDAWYIELAERMTADLDVAGFPLCRGFVMATNPVWRKRRTEWVEQIDIWSRKRNAMALRMCDIFFDFRAVHGPQEFADELRQHVREVAEHNEPFLREMSNNDASQSAALGWFNRFITLKEPPEYKGYLNLKHHGTMPLVNGVRLMALREGIVAASTLDRMAAIREKDLLDADDHDELAFSFTFIADLLLRRQVNDFEAGRKVTNYVHPSALTRREAGELKRAFKAIAAFHKRIRFEFSGEVY